MNIYRGFYPRIYDKKLVPSQALSDYYTTYVERDLRQLTSIHNIQLFHKFVSLCAGRIGQILNLSSLASDTGISHTTAREWLTLLEASYIIFTLQPYFANIGKRLIKSPKLYFYDVGLAANLLGIEQTSHVKHHPLRGNLFENMAIVEILKYCFNKNKSNNLLFFRDSKGNEVDCLFSVGHKIIPIEIKSAQTIHRDFFKAIEYFNKNIQKIEQGFLIYDGDRREVMSGVKITSCFDIYREFEKV